MNSAFYLLRTLMIGCLGGLVGQVLHLPLGWLIGAMLTTSACAMAGLHVPMAWSLRSAMIGVIGLMAGSAFTPDILSQAREWSVTLAGVAVYCVMASALGIWIAQRLAGQDRPTAIFASAPGGLSEILAMGPGYGADPRALSLVHGTRIAVVLALTPLIATSVGTGGAALPRMPRSIDLSLYVPLADVAILAACLVAGMWLGRVARLPAPHLTGPLILSAIVHGAGLTAAHPPQLVIIAAQVVIGTSVAQFFAHTTWGLLLRCLALGTGLTLLNLMLAAGFAAGYAHWLGVPFATAMIALVPGGLPEMSLVSIALGLDAAFVSTHHLFRVVVVLITLPVLVRLLARESGKDRLQ